MSCIESYSDTRYVFHGFVVSMVLGRADAEHHGIGGGGRGGGRQQRQDGDGEHGRQPRETAAGLLDHLGTVLLGADEPLLHGPLGRADPHRQVRRSVAHGPNPRNLPHQGAHSARLSAVR